MIMDDNLSLKSAKEQFRELQKYTETVVAPAMRKIMSEHIRKIGEEWLEKNFKTEKPWINKVKTAKWSP